MENNIRAEDVINKAIAIRDKLSGSDFPLHVLPHKIQEIARVTSECLGFPLDFISASLCFAISVSIGNTHSVKINQGWCERAISFMCLVGPPGSNKSSPLSFAMQPIVDQDFIESRKFKKLYKDYQNIVSLSKKEREEMGVMEIPNEPFQKRYLVSDITPETLSTIHENNKRGLCLYVDELKSWLNNFDRYNTGSALQFWLSAYSGKPIIVDRRNLTSSVSIKNSFIGVIGSIQNTLLKDLSKGEKADNGFLDRILFVVPDNLKKQYWSLQNLPSHITPMWSNIINEILMLEFKMDENNDGVSFEISFDNQAKNKLYEWQRYNTNLCNSELNLKLVSMYSKLEIYLVRFSLIMQIGKFVCKEANKDYIDLKSVESAIELTEYFRKNGQKVHKILNSTSVLEDMPSDKNKLYEALPSDFTTAEGAKIAESLNFSKDSFNRFLNESKHVLLDNYRHGRYKKYI